MNKIEYKNFFDWVDSQTTKDGFVTVSEIIKACTPDIDNDGTVNVVQYIDSNGATHIFDEQSIGENNAQLWINKLPSDVLADAKMSFDEYWAYVNA
jgi:hypothetical protein